ncbi:MAG: serine acetyltransferase [Thermodesulfobacteriota bacterium]|nr:MAG: serine acetyltransferase [Thermodesulfobacteriota bacterium]
MPTIDDELIKQVCETGYRSHQHFREELPKIVEDIVETCNSGECFEQMYSEVIPSREAIIEIIQRLREILFPGYFNKEKTDPVNLKYQMGQSVSVLFEMLAEQISRSFQHDCLRFHKPCIKCSEQGEHEAVIFLKSIPKIRRLLATDVRAAYDGDPAAQSFDEIIFSYPGMFAIMVYRIAHELYEQKIPLIPRIMTEYAHSVTGIDIHPGARIGESFFIDHGTGVVIGETTEIGKNVRLYQGVTLGALSLPKDAGEQLRGKKRHPTIEDDVIIYAEATILGEKAVIGTRSVIGGNVWITDPVPPDTRVLFETPNLIYK